MVSTSIVHVIFMITTQARLVELMEASVLLNGFKHRASDGLLRAKLGSVLVVRAAVTLVDGARVGITSTGNRWGGARVVLEPALNSLEVVPTISLDDYWSRLCAQEEALSSTQPRAPRRQPRVSLLKVDVEGHEHVSHGCWKNESALILNTISP